MLADDIQIWLVAKDWAAIAEIQITSRLRKDGKTTGTYVVKHIYTGSRERFSRKNADRLELQLTLQYMKKYGYQNVRGGKLSYSGKYLRLGSYFLRGEDANAIALVLFLMAAIAFLILKLAN